MTINLSRRGLIGMFAAGVGAAIIRTPGLIMPVKPKLVVGDGVALLSISHPVSDFSTDDLVFKAIVRWKRFFFDRRLIENPSLMVQGKD